MTWYKTGTVSLAQGSNAVIGAGTSFIANSRVGDAFRGPDGEWYEVTNIASDIALSIAPSYQGEPVSGGVYSLAPMQGYVKDSADALRAATSVIASGVANMQEQVTAATEAAATAVQAEAVAVAKADIATAAADLSTQNKESTSQDATSAGQAALRAEADAVKPLAEVAKAFDAGTLTALARARAAGDKLGMLAALGVSYKELVADVIDRPGKAPAKAAPAPGPEEDDRYSALKAELERLRQSGLPAGIWKEIGFEASAQARVESLHPAQGVRRLGLEGLNPEICPASAGALDAELARLLDPAGLRFLLIGAEPDARPELEGAGFKPLLWFGR